MTLSINSRNVELARRQLIQGGLTLGLCDDQGNPLPNQADIMDKSLCSEAQNYLTALTNVDIQELKTGQDTTRNFDAYKGKPAAKLIALINFLKPFKAPLENAGQRITLNNDYLTNVLVCKTKYEESRSYWSRFKTEFKRNAKLRWGIYIVSGIALAVATVLTAGAAAGVTAGVAFASLSVGASVNATAAGAMMTVYYGAALPVILKAFVSIIKDCFGIGKSKRVQSATQQQTNQPVQAPQRQEGPLNNSPHAALARRGVDVTQQQEAKSAAPVAAVQPAQQQSGCMGFFAGLWDAYVATHSALPRRPANNSKGFRA